MINFSLFKGELTIPVVKRDAVPGGRIAIFKIN